MQAAPGQWPGPSPGTDSPPDCPCPGSAYRIAFGPRGGQKVFTVQGPMPRDAAFTHELRADVQGFSLHAAVRCAADDRQALAQLCRTITRPALAKERVQCNAAGQVVLRLQTLRRDGTTHIAPVAAGVHAAPRRAGAERSRAMGRFATERPEVVAMPAEGCLGQTLVQQLEQEQREHLNDLSAHDDSDWPTPL